MLVLITSEILRLFVKTLPGNNVYSGNNTDNLQPQVQVELSSKLEKFSTFFIAFFASVLNFEYFG